MKVRHASSADSAAAFLESRERGKRREQARRDAESAARRAANRAARRPEEPDPPSGMQSPLPEMLPVWLPSKLWIELTEHCNEFNLSPREYIKHCLAASRLSRGGV